MQLNCLAFYSNCKDCSLRLFLLRLLTSQGKELQSVTQWFWARHELETKSAFRRNCVIYTCWWFCLQNFVPVDRSYFVTNLSSLYSKNSMEKSEINNQIEKKIKIVLAGNFEFYSRTDLHCDGLRRRSKGYLERSWRAGLRQVLSKLLPASVSSSFIISLPTVKQYILHLESFVNQELLLQRELLTKRTISTKLRSYCGRAAWQTGF